MGTNQGHATQVAMLTDLSNAFNLIFRLSFREAVKRITPDASAWIDHCYKSGGYLRLDGKKEAIGSRRGISMGTL